MDRAVDTTVCASCHQQAGGYQLPYCDCPLCFDCRAGVVYSCPVCGAHSVLTDRSRTTTGDWSGWALVVALFVAAVFGLWIAR